jgi:Nucleotidyl transferase AbiEii toxin, Type IV TA system
VSYTDAPTSVRSLEQRIRNLEGNDGLAQRRRVSMALVVVGQMLARFRSKFEEALAGGWAGFTGRLVERSAPRPPAVPTADVMQPVDVKLDYRGRSWCTVKCEIGHNEIGDADEPEFQLADDLVGLFTEVGLEVPGQVPVMRADHQIAQKLHAVSGEGSERARDLADLQLLDKSEDLDLGQVAATCVRLFDYRRQQGWPPLVVVGERWDTLYTDAAEGLDVLPAVEEAVAWVNDFVRRIAAAGRC